MPRPEYRNIDHPEYGDYLELRKKAVAELREMSKHLPQPQEDWGVIWVLSGPEQGLDEETAITEPEKKEKYNQTKRRFETGVALVKLVTALRLRKPFEEISEQDIAAVGPMMYYNPTKEGIEKFKEMLVAGRFRTDYQLPDTKISFTENQQIKHTGHQFEDFPAAMVPEGQKVVVVTDLYHMPRTTRYSHAKQFQAKVPSEQIVFYPAQPMTLPLKMTRAELQKLLGYIKEGILPPEETR